MQDTTNTGYVLSSYTVYKADQLTRFWSGLQFNFSDQFSIATSTLLGGSTTNIGGSSYIAYTQPLDGKKIAKAYICNNIAVPGFPTYRSYGLWFQYYDGTFVKNPPDDTQYICDGARSYYIPQTGSFAGMIRGFSINRVTINSNADYALDENKWSFFVDNDPCSLTTIPAQTINMMNIAVGGAQQTLDFSAFQKNTVATFHNSSSYCGTSYSFSISPTKSFLTFSSANLNGQTNSVTDVGNFIITLTVQLQPYAQQTGTFTVNVSCTILAPNLTPTSVTVEIGITSQPYTIPFTQTQSCGVSATLTSTPSGNPWLSLVSNTASGGSIQVNGATLAHVNTYSLTLTNTYLSQTQTDTLTLILKDPCSRAVFETSPSPFSTITVTVPSSTNLDTSFKVYTDVEKSNSSIVCPITATITTGYGPVSLLTSPTNLVRVNPNLVSLPTDIGTHAITVQIASPNYNGSVTAVSFMLNVVIACTVTSLTIDTTVTDFGFVINSGPLNKGAFTPIQVTNCQYSVTWTNTQYSDSNLVGPASNFDINSLSFTFSFSDPVLIGTVQKFVLRATIAQNDPITGQPMFAENTLNVTIQPDCPNTSLISKAFSDMSIIVGQSTTQDIQFQDTTGNYFSNPNFCGLRTYTFVGGLPSFLSMNGQATILTLSTSNPSDVGTHNISFNVGLFDYPQVTSISINFKVTITCVVSAIAFTQPPVNIVAEPGVTSGVTMQPVIKSFVITQTPNCGNPQIFSFVSTPPLFVTITNISTNAGNIVVSGAVLADKNVYALSLRAQVDSALFDANFQVEIKDPCSRAIFPTASPLTAMVLIRDFDSTKTQTLVVTTDIQANYSPLVCGFDAFLVSPPSFVSISGTTIAADALLTTASDVGSHTISVLVKSQLYPSTVTDATYMFTLDVQHCVVNTLTIPAISNLSYSIGIGPKTLTFTPAIWSDLACQLSATYTTTYDSSSTLPAWLTFNGSTQTFTINTTSQADLGIHSLTVTVTIPQQSGASTKQDTTSFNLSIVFDNCVSTAFVSSVVSDMVSTVSQTATTQNIFVKDTLGLYQNLADYCGPRLYTITPTKPFITIEGDVLTLQSKSPADVGTYNFSLKVTLRDFPKITAFVAAFSVTIECEVLAIQFSTSLAHIAVEPGVTSGLTMQPITKSFTIIQTPNCDKATTFSFVSTTPSFVSISNIAKNEGNIQVQGAVLADQNNYEVTLRAKVDSATIDANFQIKVSDPCKRAVFSAASPLSNMVLIRGLDSKKTQTLVVTTDVETQNSPLVCGFQAKLLDPPSFVSLSGRKITANAQLTTSNDIGLHTISLRVESLKYPNSAPSVTYTFILEVTDETTLQTSKSEEPTQTSQQPTTSTSEGTTNSTAQLQELIANAKSLGWTDWQTEFEKLITKKEERMTSNPSWKPVPPNPRIKEINSVGVTTVIFDSQILTVPDLQMINNGTIFLSDFFRANGRVLQENVAGKDVPVLSIEVVPGLESNATLLEFTWNVRQEKQRYLDINLNFSNPEIVSTHSIPDRLKITFNDPYLFIGINGMLMDSSSTEIERALPSQISRDNFIATASQIFKSSSTTVVASNFALNLVLSASLNQIFGMINTQQLIIMMPLFNIQTPGNAQTFFNVIFAIASFDFIDLDPTINKILHLNSTEPFNDKFDSLGFQRIYLLNNLGSMLLAFILYFLGILFLLIIDQFAGQSEWISKISQKLRNDLFNQHIVGIMIESYSILSVSCLINLNYLRFGTYGEFVQSAACLFTLLALIGFPLVLTINAKRLWLKDSFNDYVRSNQPFFEDLDLTKGPSVLSVPFYFLARRLLMAFTVVFLGDYLNFQVFITAMSIITAVIINGHVDGLPRSKQKAEFFNESLTMCVLYSTICFSPFVPDNNARITMGYYVCFVIALHLTVNLSLILFSNVKLLIRTFKLWRARRHLASQRRAHKNMMKVAMEIRADRRKRQEQELQQMEAIKTIQKGSSQMRRIRLKLPLELILEQEESSDHSSSSSENAGQQVAENDNQLLDPRRHFSKVLVQIQTQEHEPGLLVQENNRSKLQEKAKKRKGIDLCQEDFQSFDDRRQIKNSADNEVNQVQRPDNNQPRHREVKSQNSIDEMLIYLEKRQQIEEDDGLENQPGFQMPFQYQNTRGHELTQIKSKLKLTENDDEYHDWHHLAKQKRRRK